MNAETKTELRQQRKKADGDDEIDFANAEENIEPKGSLNN